MLWKHPSERLANSPYALSVFSRTAIEQLHLLPHGTQMYRIAEWFDADLLSPEQLNGLMARWWPEGGYTTEIGNERAAEMFRFAGFVRETPQSPRPTTEVHIFRGTTHGGEAGLSWSLEYEVAAWFANKYTDRREPGILCSTLVQPHQILGSFDGDKLREAEFVIDPRTLFLQKMTISYAKSPVVKIAVLERIIKNNESSGFADGDPEGVVLLNEINRAKIDQIRHQSKLS